MDHVVMVRTQQGPVADYLLVRIVGRPEAAAALTGIGIKREIPPGVGGNDRT